MCEELKLIQTHLGIWKLEDWSISVCSTQISGKSGVYCIKNLSNSKLLIGEGFIGGQKSRPNQHIRGNSSNITWNNDLKKYSKDNFRLIWIIPEEDEIQRKLIENKLQLHFKDNCYNQPRREYPTQKELIEDVINPQNRVNPKTIAERLNDYSKIQRNYIDECWETKNCPKIPYGMLMFNRKNYASHVLMYILHYGDICGVSSVIHHKCENKRCVNPEHLELTTNITNTRIAKKTKTKTKIKIKNNTNSSQYLGVHLKKDKYEASVSVNKSSYSLGYYENEIHAAQNRDYYIVKNNLLNSRKSTLNFHEIDYTNFNPYQMLNQRINKYLC